MLAVVVQQCLQGLRQVSTEDKKFCVEVIRISLTQNWLAQALQDIWYARLCIVLRPAVREPDVLELPK